MNKTPPLDKPIAKTGVATYHGKCAIKSVSRDKPIDLPATYLPSRQSAKAWMMAESVFIPLYGLRRDF